MKALSIMQPWCSLIAFEAKLVENRTWSPPAPMIGQRFALHASKKRDVEAFEDLRDGELIDKATWPFPYKTVRDFPISAVVGVATLDFYVVNGAVRDEYKPTRIIEAQRRWYNGGIGFVLRDVRRIEPIADVKGALGFWTLPADVAARVEEQLR